MTLASMVRSCEMRFYFCRSQRVRNLTKNKSEKCCQLYREDRSLGLIISLCALFSETFHDTSLKVKDALIQCHRENSSDQTRLNPLLKRQKYLNLNDEKATSKREFDKALWIRMNVSASDPETLTIARRSGGLSTRQSAPETTNQTVLWSDIIEMGHHSVPKVSVITGDLTAASPFYSVFSQWTLF